MTAVYDLEEIKKEVVNTLRDYFMPNNERGTFECSIHPDEYKIISQSFIPFSSVYREGRHSFPVDIMVRRENNPIPGLEVSLWSTKKQGAYTVPNQILSGSETTIPSATVPSTFGTYTRAWINLENITNNYLGSNTEYCIVFRPDPKETMNPVNAFNYYVFQRDTIDMNYWFGTATGGTVTSPSTWDIFGGNLNFSMSLPTWIYPNYPRVDLDIWSYPRLAIDIIGKPRVLTPWLSHKLAKYEMNLAVVVYSRYTDELSDILAYQDRILFKERINIPSIIELIPGNFSPASIPRQNLFARTGIHRIKFHMVADQYPK